MQASIEIVNVELVGAEGRCRAFISARIHPFDILLQNFRIMENAEGELYFAVPYYKRDNIRHPFIILPLSLHNKFKSEALKAYFSAGGSPKAISYDAHDSDERNKFE